MNRKLLCLFAASGLVAGCAASDPGPLHGPGARGEPGAPAGPRLFISPAGEPFRPNGSGLDPMRVWFDQADANHDGGIDRPEFSADHQRFFATLDLDHDGVLRGPEIRNYEENIAPEIATQPGGGRGPGGRGGGGGRGAGPRDDGFPEGGGGGGGGRGRGGGSGGRGGGSGRGGGPGGGGGGGGVTGAGRFGLLAEPEPLGAADTNADFVISTAEWSAAAERRFATLDANHDGVLRFEELHRLSAAQPGR